MRKWVGNISNFIAYSLYSVQLRPRFLQPLSWRCLSQLQRSSLPTMWSLLDEQPVKAPYLGCVRVTVSTHIQKVQNGAVVWIARYHWYFQAAHGAGECFLLFPCVLDGQTKTRIELTPRLSFRIQLYTLLNTASTIDASISVVCSHTVYIITTVHN